MNRPMSPTAEQDVTIAYAIQMAFGTNTGKFTVQFSDGGPYLSKPIVPTTKMKYLRILKQIIPTRFTGAVQINIICGNPKIFLKYSAKHSA